jgi:hypothetical protein
MSNKKICALCGGRLDRPGLHGCDASHHATPTLAQEIAAAIEYDLRNRKGMGWDSISNDTQQSIRDTWARIIQETLDKEQTR